jgi:hypothetical protein
MPIPQLPQKQAHKPSEAVQDLAAMMTPTKFSQVAATAALRIRPNRPFLLRHHPAAWRVSTTLKAVTLLPDVTMHVLEPGVNGVRTLDKHEADQPERAYEQSVFKSERDGWTYLSARQPVPADCLPAGVPAGGYLRDLDCLDPRTSAKGSRYVEAWMVPTATLPNEDQEFKFDLASYEKWLLWLVESGLIMPPMPQIGARLTARVRAHLDRAHTVPNLSPEVRQARIKARQAIVEAHEAASANPPAIGGNAEAAPKKAGRPRK